MGMGKWKTLGIMEEPWHRMVILMGLTMELWINEIIVGKHPLGTLSHSWLMDGYFPKHGNFFVLFRFRPIPKCSLYNLPCIFYMLFIITPKLCLFRRCFEKSRCAAVSLGQALKHWNAGRLGPCCLMFFFWRPSGKLNGKPLQSMENMVIY